MIMFTALRAVKQPLLKACLIMRSCSCIDDQAAIFQSKCNCIDNQAACESSESLLQLLH
jgi:hypothetical protein